MVDALRARRALVVLGAELEAREVGAEGVGDSEGSHVDAGEDKAGVDRWGVETYLS
jgi:hypothetical protein